MKKSFAALAAGVLLLSSTSCGMLEMRASTAETEMEEETTALMLDPAERKNTIETRAETEIPSENVSAEEPAAEVTFCLTGDILVDDAIIRDAANRAMDGKSYSFVRMYTGVFRNISSADIAMGSYTAADVPAGSDAEQKTPIESLAALADVGYDILDTSYAENDPGKSEGYQIEDLDTADDTRYIEKNGLTFSFVSISKKDTEKVEKAASDSDMVIVSMNWSEDTTPDERRNIARDLALAGADVIVGDGHALGSVEWIDTGDSTPTLAAYSLGNLLTTSDDPYALCSGILEFTAEATDEGLKIRDAVFSPTVVRYTEDCADYQLIMLADYTTELAADHAVIGMTPDALISYVREKIPAEFLTPGLRG